MPKHRKQINTTTKELKAAKESCRIIICIMECETAQLEQMLLVPMYEPKQWMAYKARREALRATTHLFLGACYFPTQRQTLKYSHFKAFKQHARFLQGVSVRSRCPRVIVPPLIITASASCRDQSNEGFVWVNGKQILSTAEDNISNLRCTRTAGKIVFCFNFRRTNSASLVCEQKRNIWRTIKKKCIYLDLIWFLHGFVLDDAARLNCHFCLAAGWLTACGKKNENH